MKRIMVDMSATLIHHGHIRLIKKAAEYGRVIIGLTSDEQIISCKGYTPELAFPFRKEILEAIKDVAEVHETPWLITDEVLERYQIDLLVHGDDNSNDVSAEKLLVLPRTGGISSTELRINASRSLSDINNGKLMLTPGPAIVLYESLKSIKPIFGRGDDEYKNMVAVVGDWLKELSGQDEIIMAQGSSTFALELAAHSFIHGKVLLVSTGYYSERLKLLLTNNIELSVCSYAELDTVTESFDWLMCAYTETSEGFKLDLPYVKQKANALGALLFVDATASIGLEEQHELADVMAFSSCKGLFGLTGACFIAYKNGLKVSHSDKYYFNIETHKNHGVTGPYHAIASLFGIMPLHSVFKTRVQNSKQSAMDNWTALVKNKDNQPLLCTYIEGKVLPADDNVVLYTPRNIKSGSIICHLGEVHSGSVKLCDRISIVANSDA